MRVLIALLFLVEMSFAQKEVKLITLDPGHFHAALVQKTTYPNISPLVNIYSTPGADLDLHLNRIKSYNTRAENPTNWQMETYSGPDFMDRMIAEKKGNVVVMSGNNRIKADYIAKSVNAGLNVLADKPMIIRPEEFDNLNTAFKTAAKNKVLLYDIMTERYEITTMLQRELSMFPAVFGKLLKGTPSNPSVTKESVHHFYKYVSGSVLQRPAWFMDVAQQGEGIVDVNTHLVDLIQWECFPNQIIDYKKDITITSAKRWATQMTQSQFKAITKLDQFPPYLKPAQTSDSTLGVFCNGEINYQIKGVNAKASVIWAYQAPTGAGDTHYSIMKGSRANLVIKQAAEQNYKPTLYIEPKAGLSSSAIEAAIAKLNKQFPGLSLKKVDNNYEVIIPEKYKEGHEAHFGRVMEKYLEFLKAGKMPAWEVPNMIAKYYTTTQALKIAKNGK